MEKELIRALTRNLATRELPDDAIPAVAKYAARSKHRVIGVDICKYGFCYDFMIDGGIKELDLAELVSDLPGKLADIEIFPHGIIEPDLLHVRVAHKI